jgi:hypothetical protein
VLDSSPLDLSLSPIDEWLFTPGRADADPEVMVVNDRHWDVFPEKYPIWRKTKQTFPLFRGNASKPPKILKEDEIIRYSREDVYDVPIDKLQAFKNDIAKMTVDYAAWPAGGMSKVIEDATVVEDIFYNKLKNIYTYITAPSTERPEKLIWDKIVNEFFIKVKDDTYEFYRSPRAPRSIHLDLSESGNVGSIGMCHMEIDQDGRNVIIADFTIPVSPEKYRINLDAIGNFIVDLRRIGHLNLFLVTADQYQSSSILQRVEREEIKSKRLSLDKDSTPYRVVLSWIQNGRFKIGKNIILKNNLLSLIEKKNKKGEKVIDHNTGDEVYEDGGDWKTSKMGINAKDVSDSIVGAAYNVINEYGDKIPKYQWEDEDITNIETEEGKEISQAAKDKLYKKFGFKV